MSYHQLKKVWCAPLTLGTITLFGLLAALLGAGYWYWIAWAAMLIPVIVSLRKVWINCRLS
jgi:hypothetical protein